MGAAPQRQDQRGGADARQGLLLESRGRRTVANSTANRRYKTTHENPHVMKLKFFPRGVASAPLIPVRFPLRSLSIR